MRLRGTLQSRAPCHKLKCSCPPRPPWASASSVWTPRDGMATSTCTTRGGVPYGGWAGHRGRGQGLPHPDALYLKAAASNRDDVLTISSQGRDCYRLLQTRRHAGNTHTRPVSPVLLPVCAKCFNVTLSTGKKLRIAPYSGHMFAIVVRSTTDSWATPLPKNSTNFPATPACLRC